MAKRHHKSKTRAPYGSKEKMERADYSMLTEDHSAMANMPQGVKMQYYADDQGHYLPMGYDDTLSGIDKQERGDRAQQMRALKPRKA